MTSYSLKLKLFKSGEKEKKCEKCQLENWNGLPIPLEMHHIDGNSLNNDLSNLQILCPNCHSQTKMIKSKSMTQIAKELGVSASGIKKHAQKIGIDVRAISPWAKHGKKWG